MSPAGSKPRIVYLQRATLGSGVRLRRPAFAHEWIEHPDTATGQMLERLAGATIAISNKVRLPREVIEALPALKLIAIAATGSDSIDLEACRERGVMVTNVRAYSRHSVAEHTLMLMLAASRHLKDYLQRTALGEWNQARTFYLPGPGIGDLHGKTLAIAGQGGLGSEVARLAAAFGMRIVWMGRKGEQSTREGYLPFGEALATADVVSLHCPLTPDNQHLIGEPELRTMKRSAILINTSRGRLVDESALAGALREGRIAAAAVDVLSEEPPARGNLLLDQGIPNLLVTPHVAWASAQAQQSLADELIDGLEAWARGEPVNRLV